MIKSISTFFAILQSLILFNIHQNVSSMRLSMTSTSSSSSKLILGLNKYSHDVSACVVEAATGKILFAQAKERISRKKHDGGSVSSIVNYALEYVGASIEDVALVVSNNHHYRVHPFEKRAPFAASLGYIPKSYLDDSNLLPSARHLELSHHLAHAYSVVGRCVCPFDRGLIVCMDGMGESYRPMIEHMIAAREKGYSNNDKDDNDDDYMHDLRLLRSLKESDLQRFVGVPQSLIPGAGYREAESAYVFDNRAMSSSSTTNSDKAAADTAARIIPLFKRWCRERSPPELYNHGFENMDSLGAVYSRVSSHVLGDWNACGKIMGLSPWDGKTRQQLNDWRGSSSNKSSNNNNDAISLGRDFHHKIKLMTGNPFIDPVMNKEQGFTVNWKVIDSLPHPNDFTDNRFDVSANLAASVQQDLETSVMSLLSSLKQQVPEETNLILVGGVALNSVVNGRIVKESGFDKVYIPPSPGDEGIAIGCALYGLQRWRDDQQQSPESASTTNDDDTTSKVVSFTSNSGDSTSSTTFTSTASTTAYTGGEYSDELIELSLYEYAPWLSAGDLVKHSDVTSLVEAASESLSKGETIAWFQGRSEFGQRALGHRSILGDPRSNDVRRHINTAVKQREWWRPLAPAVLTEQAHEWFDLPTAVSGSNDTNVNVDDGNVSPYMSITAQVKPDKVTDVPAICHIDDSARLQTVSPADNALFHALINAFYRRTGAPMVLNTSFNRNSEPIVESPTDAIKSFLATQGAIHKLFIGSFEVSIRPWNADILSESSRSGGSTVLMFAQPIYLSEVTTSTMNSGGTETEPVRVRVQTGAEEVSSDADEEEEAATAGWLTLPSQMHLEILQLLQVPQSPPPSSTVVGEDGEEEVIEQEQEEEAEESSSTGGVSVSELRDILCEVYVSEDDDDEEAETRFQTRFASATQWLYQRQLVYFEEVEQDQ